MLHVYAARMEKYGSNLSHSNDFRETLQLRVQNSHWKLQRCVNACSVVFFSWPTEIFPTSVLIYIVFLILSQQEIWKEKPRRAKTAAKLKTTRIDFLNSISAGHTSLIQAYRCHKILNKNYHDINGECRVKLKCYVLSVRSDRTCFIFGW